MYRPVPSIAGRDLLKNRRNTGGRLGEFLESPKGCLNHPMVPPRGVHPPTPPDPYEETGNEPEDSDGERDPDCAKQ